MKKSLKLFLILTAIVTLQLSNIAFAATAKILVETQEPLSTLNPPLTLKVKIVEDFHLKNGESVNAGDVLMGRITSVTEAKRGKRDASFAFKLTTYVPVNTPEKPVLIKNPNAIAKGIAYNPLDLKETSLNVGASAANFVVPYISYPINFVRGLVAPEEDKNRLESAVQKTYETSVVSYASKGEEIDVKAGDKLILVFNYNVPEQEQNTIDKAQQKVKDVSSTVVDTTKETANKVTTGSKNAVKSVQKNMLELNQD